MNLKSEQLKIAPSILAANWAHLADEVAKAEAGGAALIHVDVMDGHFVPNVTMGMQMVKALKPVTTLPLDVHLMIENPAMFAGEFIDAGASMVSVHAEADAHLHRTLSLIRQRGASAGVAINPATSLSLLDEAIYYADFVVFMSVNPGFGGQKFINHSYDKLRRLRQMIDERDLNVEIEIDGGIDATNILRAAQAGANIFVAGSSVFGTNENPRDGVRKLIEAGTNWV